MNGLMLSRLLGWFSLGLGAAEIVTPRYFSRRLGLPVGSGVLNIASQLANRARAWLEMDAPNVAVGLPCR